MRLRARALSSLLLASLLSLMVVLADHLVFVWSNGKLIVAIAVMWGVLFLGLALFAGVVHRWSERVALRVHGAPRRLMLAAGESPSRMLAQARLQQEGLPELRSELCSDEPANGVPPRDPAHLR